MRKLSARAAGIEPSLTRRLFNMASGYQDVIDLTLGDPDMPPDKRVMDSACEAIEAGRTRYSANAGLAELRVAFAETVAAEYGVSYDPRSEVIVTVGGMEALYLALSCIVDTGDEVLLQAPYYVNYVQMVRLCGGVPVPVGSTLDEGFVAPVSRWEEAASDRTAAMLLNTPANPTGALLDARTLDGLAGLARDRDLLVLSDEVYRTLVYGGARHESVLTRGGMRERTVLIDSASKRFAMTGYRIGFAAGPSEVISAMVAMQENVAACAALPSQHAAVGAYRRCAEDARIREAFERRRDLLCERLGAISQLRFVRPQGAFYAYVDVSGTGLDGESFAYALLESERVAVVPGVAYGRDYGDYVRIAYTLDEGRLAEAVERIGRFVAARGGSR